MKCGNCNIEFADKARFVAHMVTVHDSPFKDGDPELVEMSNKMKDNPAVKAFRNLMEGM